MTQRILVKSTLEKPQWGENQWERGSSSYFFKSGNYISRIKPTVYLSLPRNSCMNLTGKITTLPSFSVPRLSYSTACPELMLCDLLWKSCPENGSSRTIAVQLYGWVNAPSLPRFLCCCVCWNWTVCSAVPNPYRTDFFFCWLPRFPCYFFALEIVPLFSAANPPSEMGNPSPILALSQSLKFSWKEWIRFWSFSSFRIPKWLLGYPFDPRAHIAQDQRWELNAPLNSLYLISLTQLK